MITIHAIWTWLLLISSALLAKTVNTLDSKNNGNISYCDSYDKTNTDHQCGQLVAGVVSIAGQNNKLRLKEKFFVFM